MFSYLLALYIKSRQERTKRKIVNPHIGLFVRQSLLSYLMSLQASQIPGRFGTSLTWTNQATCAHFHPPRIKRYETRVVTLREGRL